MHIDSIILGLVSYGALSVLCILAVKKIIRIIDLIIELLKTETDK